MVDDSCTQPVLLTSIKDKRKLRDDMTTADVPSEDTTVTFADLPEEVLELVFSLFSKTTAAVACSVNQQFYSLLKPLCVCFKELKRIRTQPPRPWQRPWQPPRLWQPPRPWQPPHPWQPPLFTAQENGTTGSHHPYKTRKFCL